MKAYRMFFLFSLCAHILLLAFMETFTLSSRHRSHPPLKVTLLQTALPFPVGEQSGEPSRPAEGTNKLLSPEPVQKTPPQPLLQLKPRHKPTPKPKRPVSRSRPKAVPFPSVEQPARIGLLAEGTRKALAKDGYAALESGQGIRGQREDGSSGTSSGGARGKGRGGRTLASPDYGVNPKPPYPLIARRMGVEGVVVLRVFVHADGSVAKALIRQSSDSTLLDESALKTVREHWRFLPAHLDGEPVESWVEVPIHFVLAG